jgi:hypothetical protein
MAKMEEKKVTKNILIDYTKWLFKWMAIAILSIILIMLAYDDYQKKEAERIEAKEYINRECLAKEIPKLELEIKKVSDLVDPFANIEETQKNINDNSGMKYFDIIVANDNIKNRVLVYKATTSCKGNFDFLINIREDDNRALNYFSVWAENSPKGYQSGYIESFHKDYSKARLLINSNSNKLKDSPSSAYKKPIESFDNNAGLMCQKNKITLNERVSLMKKISEVKQVDQYTFKTIDNKHLIAVDVFEDLIQCY